LAAVGLVTFVSRDPATRPIAQAARATVGRNFDKDRKLPRIMNS
jgi:hypothetical protein